MERIYEERVLARLRNADFGMRIKNRGGSADVNPQSASRDPQSPYLVPPCGPKEGSNRGAVASIEKTVERTMPELPFGPLTRTSIWQL